jgi:hypothetical protein
MILAEVLPAVPVSGAVSTGRPAVKSESCAKPIPSSKTMPDADTVPASELIPIAEPVVETLATPFIALWLDIYDAC